MATQSQIPIAEYLKTSYRPDREYLDGELRERNVGKWEHARLQALMAAWFIARETGWNVMVSTEQRTWVTASRVRIPDLVLVRGGQQPEVLVAAPVLIVEILSPDDTYSDTQERAADYQSMGVETIWIIDPQTRTGRMCVGAAWIEAPRLEVAGTDIYLELEQIFQYLDRPSSL